MSFYAYSKKEFFALDFDGWSYKFPTEKDVGDSFATLDCKRWGGICMFLYLTMTDGSKIFTPVYKRNNYFGFKDIPIGAVVDTSFDIVIGAQRAYLIAATWYPNETDAKDAERRFYEGEDMVAIQGE